MSCISPASISNNTAIPRASPELYWNEALRRDPGDARCNIGMGRRALKQGRLDAAEAHFQKAIARLTRRHPNPETGEAHYFLGLTLVFKGEFEAAYPLFYKATWNQAWRVGGVLSTRLPRLPEV